MSFEDFPKEYEDVFSNEKSLKKCKLDLVTIDTGEDIKDYMDKLNVLMADYQSTVFNHLVKIIWMFRRFCYGGFRKKGIERAGRYLDGAFGVFMRRHVGYDAKVITRNFVYLKVISYFDEFFPDFDINNPFESKYAYPYKYMTFEMLTLVANMPERLQLLESGERRKYGHAEFFDYVINYVNCYNDKHGVTYEFKFSTMLCAPYVKKYERKEIQAGDLR